MDSYLHNICRLTRQLSFTIVPITLAIPVSNAEKLVTVNNRSQFFCTSHFKELSAGMPSRRFPLTTAKLCQISILGKVNLIYVNNSLNILD